MVRVYKVGDKYILELPGTALKNMKLEKPILEKNKKDLEKMKIQKFNPSSPT